MYMESRKTVLMILFAAKDGDADVDSGLVDTVEEAENMTYGENSINI